MADTLEKKNILPISVATATSLPAVPGGDAWSKSMSKPLNNKDILIKIPEIKEESVLDGPKPKLIFENDLGGGIVIKSPLSEEDRQQNWMEEKRLIESFANSSTDHLSSFVTNPKEPLPFRTLHKGPGGDWNKIYVESMKWIIDRGLHTVSLITSSIGSLPPKEKAKCTLILSSLNASRRDTLSGKIIALGDSVITLNDDFEKITNNMYQRFAPTDETIFYLEAVVQSLLALMEWNRVWKDVRLARATDFRGATQHAITGLSLSIRSLLEDAKNHAILIERERQEYEKHIMSIAPKKMKKNLEGSWAKVNTLKAKYEIFLEKILLQKDGSGEIIIPIEMLHASLDLLRRSRDAEILPILRTVMYDVQESLDMEALDGKSSSSSKDVDNTVTNWNQKKIEYEKILQKTEDERKKRTQMQEKLDNINRTLLQNWSTGQWINLELLKRERETTGQELQQIDKSLATLTGDAGATIRSLTKLSTEKRKMDVNQLAIEHRYGYLNELLTLTQQISSSHGDSSMANTQNDLYYRAVDMLQEETLNVRSNIRQIATEKIYLSGIYWAEEFSNSAQTIASNSDNLQQYLKEQKTNLDEVLVHHKRRLVLQSSGKADVADVDISRLQSIYAQYANTLKELADSVISLEDKLAFEDLNSRLCKLDKLDVELALHKPRVVHKLK